MRSFCSGVVALVAVLLLVQSLPAQEGTEAKAAVKEAAAKGGMDTAYLPSECFTAIVFRPKQITEAAALRPLAQAGLPKIVAEQIKVDPAKMEQFTMGLLPALKENEGREPVLPFLISRFRESMDVEEIVAAQFGPMEEATLDGKSYLVRTRSGNPVAWLPDKRTIVVTDKQILKQVVNEGRSTGPLIASLLQIKAANEVAVIVQMAPVRDLLGEAVKQVPEEFRQAAKMLLTDVEWVRAVVDLEAETPVSITLVAANPDSAAKIETVLRKELGLLKEQFAGEGKKLFSAMPSQVVQPIFTLLNELVTGAELSRDGKRVVIRAKTSSPLETHAKAFVPLVARARQSVPPQRVNNMKMIGLAMHNYHDVHGQFPLAASEKNGKPLLSWRVQLLPYLEQQALYKKFHLDEPWDSPNNKPLLKEIPSVYRISPKDTSGKTRIQVFVGKDTAFDLEGLSFSAIKDGTSQTLMCVEAGEDKAVLWTKPDDLTFDPKKPLAALGNIPGESFLTLFFDGSVRPVPKSIDAEQLGRLIMPADGKPVGDF